MRRLSYKFFLSGRLLAAARPSGRFQGRSGRSWISYLRGIPLLATSIGIICYAEDKYIGGAVSDALVDQILTGILQVTGLHHN